MRVRLQREVDVAVPASVLWDYLTDWPRQEEWVPFTTVERLDDSTGIGQRFRAWTGIGRPPAGSGRRGVSFRGVGFWDPMTVTVWKRTPDGGGRCDVLHLGAVVKGEGEFVVLARGERASRFVWAEVIVLPLGRLGAAGWRLARPVVERVIDRGLRTMRDRVEEIDRESQLRS
ncbi:MAG TPA: SRPBCC family protein [Nocardioidaceae bacterium]|nr:SRPBCC family protein [Nocardioidaceae bacterium]